MTNQKKGAQIGVFHILKSVVDAKVPKLQDRVSAGKRAQTEYPILVDNIKALRQYVMNSRTFDPSEYREAAADLDDKEMQLGGIQKRIDNGRAAERELAHVASFNQTYGAVCKKHNNASRIHELRAVADELEERMSRLEDKIWACQINMDNASRAPYVVAQAHSDADDYVAQYQEVEERLLKVMEQIRQLEK